MKCAHYSGANGAAIRAAMFLCAVALGSTQLRAQQNGPVVARTASVSGTAIAVSGNPPSSFRLSPGFLLNPGDRIDTRGGGRVVIDLSDGSMVVIEPQSIILIKDFRQADSLRELFEILSGKVRVHINHFTGRPNPYRMNSPTASIAVRGTEFTIEVTANGDTQVVVFDGAVEVTSLSDPSRAILVEAGRGVLVQAGRAFRMLGSTTNPGQRADGEDGDRRGAPTNQNGEVAGNNGHSNTQGSGTGTPQPRSDSDGATPRATASAYDTYVAGLSGIAQTPFLYRFNAFAESHLDSLENPAYATQFSSAEARLFVLPTFGGGSSVASQSLETYGPAGAQSGGSSITPQLSMFSPVGHSGFVIGGSVSGTREGNSSVAAIPDEASSSSQHGATVSPVSGKVSNNFYAASIVAAKQLGAATSVGVEFESLRGNGSSTTAITDNDGQPAVERIASASHIAQNKLTLGFSFDLGRRAKWGVFYRYAFISATDRDLSHTLDGSTLGLNSTGSSGHSSELGFRLRGELNPKFFYGFAGSWSGVSLESGLVRTALVNSHEHDRAQRGSAGIGIGYALTSRTVLTLDASGGTSRVAGQRVEVAGGNTLQNSTANSHFAAAHVAVQSDLTRRLFVTMSFLNIWQAQAFKTNLFPDLTGATADVGNSFFPGTQSTGLLAPRVSDFGAGWRFSRKLFVQYLFTTNYGVTAPNHALMLRYTFNLGKR